jgi:hypothetical protein
MQTNGNATKNVGFVINDVTFDDSYLTMNVVVGDDHDDIHVIPFVSPRLLPGIPPGRRHR